MNNLQLTYPPPSCEVWNATSKQQGRPTATPVTNLRPTQKKEDPDYTYRPKGASQYRTQNGNRQGSHAHQTKPKAKC